MLKNGLFSMAALYNPMLHFSSKLQEIFREGEEKIANHLRSRGREKDAKAKAGSIAVDPVNKNKHTS